MTLLLVDSFDYESCPNWHECKNGGRYGKGCYTDDLNNAMGGKPWQECHCGIDSDGNYIVERKMTNEQKVTRTKLFLDTEFTGLHKNTTLISLGLVSECGRRFYAEFTDYDRTQIDEWLQDNVIANTCWLKTLDSLDTSTTLHFDNFDSCAVLGNTIAVKNTLESWLSQFGSAELEVVADTLAFDWVLFCNIWDHAFNVPSNVFYIPTDISALFALLENDADISRQEYCGHKPGDILDFLPFIIRKEMGMGTHNALYDAEVTRLCYNKLMKRHLDTLSILIDRCIGEQSGHKIENAGTFEADEGVWDE